MPLKHNNINGGASSAKNTLAPQSKIFLYQEIKASQNIILNFFKLSPTYGDELLVFV